MAANPEDIVPDSTGSALRNNATDYSELKRRLSARGDAIRNYSPDMSETQARLGAQPGPIASIAANPTAAPGTALTVSGAAGMGGEAGTSVGPSIRTYTPPPGLPAPDITDVTPRAASGGSGAIGRLAQAAGPLESAARSAVGKAGPLVAAVPDAIDTARVAANPNSTIGDVAQQGIEGAGRVGAGLAGAQLGSIAGAAIGGPAAPVTGTIGALAGGAIGYMGGSAAINAIRSAVGLGDKSPIERLSQQASIAAPPSNVAPGANGASNPNIVPGANGSTVQINGDGTAQLASRPTIGANSDMGGPNFGIAGGGWDAANGAGAGPATIAQPSQQQPKAAAQAQQALQQAPQAPAANPFDGAVQIIRPGNQVTWAVPSTQGMTEIGAADYDAYRSALAKNPGMASRLQITAAGPMVDGVAVPANVVANGGKSVDSYLQATQQNSLNMADPLGASVRAKVAETMADPSIATGGASNAAHPNGALTGAELLKTLDPGMAAQIKGMDEGRISVPTGAELRTPLGQLKMRLLNQYDSQADATTLAARKALREDAAKGKIAQTNNAVATVVGHMGDLTDMVDKLDTVSGFPGATLVNGGINAVEGSMGKTNVSNFNATRNSVAAELVKAWRATGGSVDDIQKRLEDLNAAHSKDQLHQVLGTLADQLHSKVQANEEQWSRVMGPNIGPSNFISPATRASLEKIYNKAGLPSRFAEGADASSQAPAAQPAAAAAPNRKTIGGKTYENDGQGWHEVN